MADSVSVVMIDRTTYDLAKRAGTLNNDTIYFVREGTSELAQILSLYVGLSWQCDLLDITEDPNVSFNAVTNEYDIPQSYHIHNKLLFYKQTIVTDKVDNSTNETYDYYRIVMWDGEKFRDCMGLPNNVIVCSDSIPNTADAIKDFVYIDVANRNIYVFDGNSYIPIIELSQYATKTWVEDYHNSHSQTVQVDNVTIQKTAQNVLYGAAADIGEKTFVFDGSTTITTKKGATALNMYPKESDEDYNDTNIAVTPNTVIGGWGNREAYPLNPPQYGPYDQYKYGSNFIFGMNGGVNPVTGGPSNGKGLRGLNGSIVVGKRNLADVDGYTCGNAIFGNYNAIAGTADSGQSESDASAFMFGSANTITVTNWTQHANAVEIGHSNNINDMGVNMSYTIGNKNSITHTVTRGNYYPVFAVGSQNTVVDCAHLMLLGEKCTYDIDPDAPETNQSEGSTILGSLHHILSALSGTTLFGSQTLFRSDTYDGTIPDSGHGGSAFRCTIGGFQNSITCTSDANNTGHFNGIGYTTILGNSNNISSGSYGDLSYSEIIGSFNTCDASNTSIIGQQNTSHQDYSIVIGNNLTCPTFAQDSGKIDFCMVVGSNNNTSMSLPTGAKPRFVIGNGGIETSGSSVIRTPRNAMVVDSFNNMFLYGEVINTGGFTSESNFTNSEKDISLVSTIRNSTVTQSGGVYEIATLPRNNDETIINSSSTTGQMEITDLVVPINGTNVAVNLVEDYCATIAFKKASSLTSASDILTNFTSGSQNRIYLLNPDIDISTYTIIHLLLFYDGFNMCCTVAGYEEDPGQ